MNEYQEALNKVKSAKILLHMHDDIVNEIKVFEEDDINIELLKDLVIKQSVFQELYEEYVINPRHDTLTEGAIQLAYALETINDSMGLAIELNRLENTNEI